MITEQDIRFLALLYWQAKCIVETGMVVPLILDGDEEIGRMGESVKRLTDAEMINGVNVIGDFTFPNPNEKACEFLNKHVDLSRKAFQEFDVMAREYCRNVRQPIPNPNARPRKKLKRRVS